MKKYIVVKSLDNNIAGYIYDVCECIKETENKILVKILYSNSFNWIKIYEFLVEFQKDEIEIIKKYNKFDDVLIDYPDLILL